MKFSCKCLAEKMPIKFSHKNLLRIGEDKLKIFKFYNSNLSSYPYY